MASMGLFDRGGQDDELLVVKQYVKNAGGTTVTKKNLNRRLAGNKSLLSYLRDSEQPHYILHNRKKGLTYNERGEKDTIEPSSGDRAYGIFTNQRTLFLVGTDRGTQQWSLSHDKIEKVEASSGLTKHRLDLKTLYANYRFYVSNSINSDEFKAAVHFLRQQAGLEKTRVGDAAQSAPRQARGQSASVDSEDKQNVLKRLRTTDPYEFEHFVADLWEAQGWDATVSQASVDQGVDIIATKDSPFQQKQVIQAKRYAQDNTIGSPKVQQYSSLRQQVEGADAAVIVTTSNFSSQAESIAENLNVKLVDAEDIYALLQETGRFDLVSQYSPIPNEPKVEDPRLQNQNAPQNEPDTTGEAPDIKVTPVDKNTNQSSILSKEYKECPTCVGFTAHEPTWRKDLIFPVLRCSECQMLHHKSDDKLTPLAKYISDRDKGTKKYGYYGIFSGILLAILGPAIPLFGLLAYFVLPYSMSRDIRYVRSNSERDPATGYWVWAAILLPAIGFGVLEIAGVALSLSIIGGAYLIHRYRKDSPESGLHQGRIASLLLRSTKE